MGEAILRDGSWWTVDGAGVWARWDPSERAWIRQGRPPPDAARPGTFRDLEALRRWPVALMILAVIVDALAVLSGLAERSLLERALRGEVVTIAEAEANDTRQGAIALAQTIIFLATVVVFLRWFHAAYANLPALGSGVLRYGTGWAIGGWFVPVLNLWRPKQIANDVWRASDPGAPPLQGRSWWGGPIPAFLTGWWAFWILSGWVAIRALRLDDSSIEGLRSSTEGWIAADSLSVVAGVLAIMVVNRITARQAARAAVLGIPPAPAGWGSGVPEAPAPG